MHLSQSPAAANVCDNANNARDRQGLEQSPAVVVQEEYTLHRDNAAKEKAMRDRLSAKCLANVIKVSTKSDPQSHQGGQCEKDCEHENAGDDLRRRLRIGLEDVVDLRLRGVALGCGWEGERHSGVAGDFEVEDVLVDRCGRAEGCDNDRSLRGFGGGQELEGEVLLGLKADNEC